MKHKQYIYANIKLAIAVKSRKEKCHFKKKYTLFFSSFFISVAVNVFKPFYV